MVGREMSGGGVARNHRVGGAGGVAQRPPGVDMVRSQQEIWPDEDSCLDAEVVSLLQKVRETDRLG